MPERMYLYDTARRSPGCCTVCNNSLFWDAAVLVDHTGGDVCATDVERYGENHPHYLNAPTGWMKYPLYCGTCGTQGTEDDGIEVGGECAHDDCNGTIKSSATVGEHHVQFDLKATNESIDVEMDWDGYTLAGRIDDIESLANAMLAECQIKRQTLNGEI